MSLSATSVASRLESLAGTSHVLSQAAECERYAVDGLAPAAVVRPLFAEEVAEILRFAAAEKLAVIPCGSRTKLGIGMPPSRYDFALDMTGLSRIAHYDPGDLTLSVDAGMPIGELNAILLERKQFLPLLVPYYSQSTVGGTIASGVDSPLRQFYGTARDFIIGAEFVTGTGAFTKSGGRVVKNVTGYDVHKLLVGSLGTLAVITRVNFRTFPAPPANHGFVASFSSGEGALELRRRIVNSPLTPLTLDVLNPRLAQIFATRSPRAKEGTVFPGENQNTTEAGLPPPGDWMRPKEWQLCVAFGGTPEVLERYARDLARFAGESGATSAVILDDVARPAVWGRLRESLSMLLEASPAAAIFKLSLLPGQHASSFARLREIAERASLPHALVARAVGTIYFALLPENGKEETIACLAPAAAALFEHASAAGGHATMLFAPTALKQRVSIWGPARGDLPLIQRVKKAFDPVGVLVPGRFAGGI